MKPGPPARDSKPQHDRRPEGPRRIRGGVKLRARSKMPTGLVADRVLASLDRTVTAEGREEGWAYGRAGQTASLDLRAGGAFARVQGRAARPYDVEITIEAFSEETWDRVIDVLAAEAGVMIKLLAGELPDRLDERLAELGVVLLPPDDAPLEARCSCVRGGGCKHVATIAYLLAEACATSPMLIFALRGLPAEHVLERIRQTRQLDNRGVAAAHADPHIPQAHAAVPPLDDLLDTFWRPHHTHATDDTVPTPAIPHALLRRLGPSPLGGKFPLVGLLASVYDEVSEVAREFQDADRGEVNDGADDEDDAAE